MTDLEAKTAILAWARFKKGWHYVATEMEVMPGYRADVMASDDTVLIEFEVKTNIADVKRDFKNKAEKHVKYSNAEVVATETGFKKGPINGVIEEKFKNHWLWRTHWDKSESTVSRSPWNAKLETREAALAALEKHMLSKVGVPHQLVYVVHESIAEECKELIPKEYGIVSFKNSSYSYVRTVRKATKLHDGPLGKNVPDAFLARMSSEIANLHITLSAEHYVRSFHRMAIDECNKQDATGIDGAISGD